MSIELTNDEADLAAEFIGDRLIEVYDREQSRRLGKLVEKLEDRR